ncbi:cytochrome c oxidase subunit 2A [Thermus antranikianii]|uniref:Cytochrome c oxidase subunit 2A n=1 Tax=Thermus antranikianii TaxID=88190 RepID=A0ABY7RSQ9_9DEIN|nr:cytochrome c oxidase subunit 2A [Thermus antranikianii]
MEEKPVGAIGVIVVLTLTILVFWLGVYAVFFSRGRVWWTSTRLIKRFWLTRRVGWPSP